jgi:hypothetical protein
MDNVSHHFFMFDLIILYHNKLAMNQYILRAECIDDIYEFKNVLKKYKINISNPHDHLDCPTYMITTSEDIETIKRYISMNHSTQI